MFQISPLMFFSSEKQLYSWTCLVKKTPLRTKILISPVWNKIFKMWDILFELINIEVQCSKNEFKNSWLSLRIIIVVHFSLFLRESLKILFKIYFLRSLHRKYSLLKFENCCLFAYTVSIIYIYSPLCFRANFTILQGFQNQVPQMVVQKMCSYHILSL